MHDDKNNIVNKWIDFDALPHNKSQIDWKKSIGYEIGFRHNDIIGTIKILSYDVVNKMVCIYIDGYTNKCGHQISISHLHKCQLTRILRKPLCVTHPHLVKYFVHKSDTEENYLGSDKYVLLICPYCGTLKKQRINNLVNKGFSCPACSDGISWPNKFMFNILKQLDCDFENEVNKSVCGFEWIDGNYRYDFYLKTQDDKLLIELDGKMHDNDGADEIDKLKDDMAYKNGFRVVRIDCRYNDIKNRFDFIKSNIVNSLLKDILDLNKVDWDAAHKSALQSNLILAAQMWNNNLRITDISLQLKVHATTVSDYLKVASKLNLCDYSFNESLKRRSKNVAESVKKIKSKHVAVYKYDNLLNVFFNAQELSDMSVTLYGVFMHRRNICSVCNGKRKGISGYTMQYISNDEYEHYKQFGNNNTKLLKEVC